MGAWIEIMFYLGLDKAPYVAPDMGAWIEIIYAATLTLSNASSLPTWERGLKSHYYPDILICLSRSRHGSVD